MSAMLELARTSLPPVELDGVAILENIRALRPMLRERSDEIELGRRVPDDVVALLRASGAMRMMMPRAWGGPEMNLVDINIALEELALGNAAAAWCVMIQLDSGLYSGMLEEDTGRRLYPSLDTATSNVIRAAGRARQVEGGYIVNGRWSFASGCLHTDLFAGGCLLYGDDGDEPLKDEAGQPLHRMALARRDQLIAHDTWHTLGLRGTGSCDIEIKDLFLPADQLFDLGGRAHDGALYRWPAVLCAKMPGVVLGLARNAIETVEAILRERKEASDQATLALAKAHTLYASARAYVHGALAALGARLDAGELPDEAERVAVFLSRANAFQSARDAVQLLFDALGGAAIYAGQSALERHLRDINTACQHVMAQRRGQEAAGRLILGFDAQFSFL
ncbi:acyl-CoA dehydrogenase family protein [Duganella sp. HH101]|uniref:acyl-CoA dehydrogenase family protein n=1 Tax=Duganella sp. HH101 TaxID=1781066 RepID=UPI00089394B6|nr:acyl-CoA dehydrogenase family protein [Duganella sp. HH101]OFA06935.1 flavin-dependent monooxygenase, oxygenase subunit HsaA [Duganella sp. HH101]